MWEFLSWCSCSYQCCKEMDDSGLLEYWSIHFSCQENEYQHWPWSSERCSFRFLVSQDTLVSSVKLEASDLWLNIGYVTDVHRFHKVGAVDLIPHGTDAVIAGLQCLLEAYIFMSRSLSFCHPSKGLPHSTLMSVNDIWRILAPCNWFPKWVSLMLNSCIHHPHSNKIQACVAGFKDFQSSTKPSLLKTNHNVGVQYCI